MHRAQPRWLARLSKSAPFAAPAILLLALFPAGCRKPAQSVTLTYFDSEGMGVAGDQRMIPEAYLQEFTRETGIRVNDLPTPEDNTSKLALATELLRGSSAAPDIYGIDTIWSGTLSDYLVDLQPYFAAEISAQDPEILNSYVVGQKLVAMPYHPNLHVLLYRTDLLAKYGYKTPPRTWDELEQMAVRIQDGERAQGNKDFWGFVWSGAITTDSEQLTCEGLEWQAAEGGGHVIEPDGTVSVNNPNAVRAWERAAHWVGWITPPSVVSYNMLDAENKFWVSGTVAFQLGWTDTYELYAGVKPFRDKAGVTSVPAGASARLSTLGGYSLGIARNSAHRAEAVQFVQFMIRKQAQFVVSTRLEMPGRKVEYFEVPRVMNKVYPWWSKPGDTGGSQLVLRPSAVAGPKYEAVSKDFSRTLHSVLAHQSTAQAAAAALENELVQIGFKRPQPAAGVH